MATKQLPKVSHLWRRRGAGFWCRVDEVKGTKALMRSPTGRANWVSFDTLWSKWEAAGGAAVAAMATTPPAQPSALERARKEVDALLNNLATTDAWYAGQVRAAVGLLVSEVRAEEREACALKAVDAADSWGATVAVAEDAATKEVAEWAERACMDVARRIRARR